MEHRRKHAAFATGKAFMWHRRLVQKEDGEWIYEACGHEAGDKNRISDSRVHRYSRERDFVRPDQAEVDEDDEAREALLAMREGRRGPRSHETRVYRFSLFERYVLERHPASAYAKWLDEIAHQVGSEEERQRIAEDRPELLGEQLAFCSPPSYLVSSWLSRLRKDPYRDPPSQPGKPDHKSNTCKCVPLNHTHCLPALV